MQQPKIIKQDQAKTLEIIESWTQLGLPWCYDYVMVARAQQLYFQIKNQYTAANIKSAVAELLDLILLIAAKIKPLTHDFDAIKQFVCRVQSE